jgi:hypothetical protein
VSNPFTQWREKTEAPYWIREDDAALQAEHIERLRRLGYIHSLSPEHWLGPRTP